MNGHMLDAMVTARITSEYRVYYSLREELIYGLEILVDRVNTIKTKVDSDYNYLIVPEAAIELPLLPVIRGLSALLLAEQIDCRLVTDIECYSSSNNSNHVAQFTFFHVKMMELLTTEWLLNVRNYPRDALLRGFLGPIISEITLPPFERMMIYHYEDIMTSLILSDSPLEDVSKFISSSLIKLLSREISAFISVYNQILAKLRAEFVVEAFKQDNRHILFLVEDK